METKYIATPALLRRALHRAKHFNQSRRGAPTQPATTSPCEDEPPRTLREGVSPHASWVGDRA
jgi:hypothetical protein